MKRFALAIGLALIASPAMAETLNNESVVTLVSAGLGDEAVIAKIKASDAAYDLSTDAMVALKARGVSGPVIAAMLSASAPKPAPVALSMDSPDPMVPHASGFYMLSRDAAGDKMRRIDATMTNQAKTGGTIGFIMTGGIASMSIKATVPGERARIQTAEAQPTFFMFFDESNSAPAASVWSSGSAQTITSPAELTLVELRMKDERREARVGSANIGGTKVGVMDKDRRPFDYELVRPGVYRVKPVAPLEKGEYGFIYSMAGGGTAGAMTARIFDFGVM